MESDRSEGSIDDVTLSELVWHSLSDDAHRDVLDFIKDNPELDDLTAEECLIMAEGFQVLSVMFDSVAGNKTTNDMMKVRAALRRRVWEKHDGGD
jgi:hypothetical protein